MLLSITTYGQVNVSISNMQYIDGTPISDCGIIDFGTNSTVRVQFTINLSKQSTQVVGTSNLYVYTIGSSGSRIERKNEVVQQESFDTNYQSSADITMSASDFNTSGGTLFAVFKSSGGTEYQTTCSYSITKTPLPTFTLSPTSVSLVCGSTSSRVFTVTPANIPNGATVTYSWSYNGCSLVSSTATSRTLIPNSGTNLPSSVSVTPSINGVAQQTKTATVSRSNIAKTITDISGASTLCSGSTSYTFGTDNVLPGQTVTWSLSNSTVATLSNASNTGVTLNVIGSGAVTLTATISNGCGQSYTRTKTYLEVHQILI